jgi:uncharacterized protein YdaL
MVSTRNNTTQLRLLDLGSTGDRTGPGSPLFDIHAPVRWWTQAVMTPNGKTVFLDYNFSYGPRGLAVSTSLLRFSAVTGQLAKVNKLPLILVNGHAAGYSNSGPLIANTVLWTNYNGTKVIVADAARGNTIGVYSGGTYTPLPWPANAIGAAW